MKQVCLAVMMLNVCVCACDADLLMLCVLCDATMPCCCADDPLKKCWYDVWCDDAKNVEKL